MTRSDICNYGIHGKGLKVHVKTEYVAQNSSFALKPGPLTEEFTQRKKRGVVL